MPASAAKAATADPSEAKAPSGSQTLLRGLDLIDAVADRPIALAELASRLGLTRSTTHRLASALIDRRFLTFTPRQGYRLGPKLLELGFLAPCISIKSPAVAASRSAAASAIASR
jgi:AraC-like DNA-binding protein